MANAIRKAGPKPCPDFVKLAEAFGCKGIKVDNPDDLDEAIKEMLGL